MQGFRIVDLRMLFNEAKLPIGEPQPISAFDVGFGPKCVSLRLRRVTLRRYSSSRSCDPQAVSTRRISKNQKGPPFILSGDGNGPAPNRPIRTYSQLELKGNQAGSVCGAKTNSGYVIGKTVL
jgi:hypothetical protein